MLPIRPFKTWTIVLSLRYILFPQYCIFSFKSHNLSVNSSWIVIYDDWSKTSKNNSNNVTLRNVTTIIREIVLPTLWLGTHWQFQFDFCPINGFYIVSINICNLIYFQTAHLRQEYGGIPNETTVLPAKRRWLLAWPACYRVPLVARWDT